MSVRVHEEVDRVLEDWGDHPVLMEVTPGAPTRVLSATDLQEGIRETAAFLSGAGVGPHIPVALVLDNSTDFVRIFLALLRIGAIPVPLKPEYRSLELEEIFANARPEVVIAEDRHLETLRGYLESRTVISRCETVLHLEREAGRRLEPAELDGEVASLNYTYRGYGYPLGAMVTHGQYLQGARVLQDGLQGERGERMLFNLPMSHIFSLVGCIFVPLLHRMTAVIARTFHPRHLFRIIAEHGIDHITAVPEIYLLLARLKERSLPLPTLKTFVSGGSALQAEEYNGLRQAFGVEVLHGYGLTEFAPASRNMRGRARAGTIGPLCATVQARIDAPDGRGNGQILLKTPFLSRGYYRRPRETREAFQDDWFQTGDLGRFEGDHLVFIGEKKRTCKVNGSMVDLEEVRRAILLDPEVATAEVRKEDGILTARIGVASRVGVEEKIRLLTAFLKSRVSEQKIPKRIVGE